MTVVQLFADLRVTYPSWDSLRTFLTSDAGGNLLIVGEGDTVIIRYDKKTSNFNIPYTHAFRSVVWDTVQNLPLSVAPFKAATSVEPSPGEVDLLQDFLEGVMLHVYRPIGSTELHLSTRSKLGAATRFYSKRNFSELVKDAPEWGTLASILPVGSFASIVLQHPEHRIVSPVTVPRLYIVDVGMVHTADGRVDILVDPAQWSEGARALAPPTQTAASCLSEGMRPTDLVKGVAKGPFWQGFVLKNSTTLARWRIRNPLYTLVRDLRGAEADSYMRFLRLRKSGSLYQYIAYYPEDTDEFHALEGTLRDQTRALYNAYNEVHRGHKEARKELKSVAWPYNTHIYKLHGMYIANKAEPITLERVITYMNTLDCVKQRAFLVTARVAATRVAGLTAAVATTRVAGLTAVKE